MTQTQSTVKCLFVLILSDGNTYNKKTKTAFGNDEEEDEKFLKNTTETFIGIEGFLEDGEINFRVNMDLFLADAANRIQVKPIQQS